MIESVSQGDYYHRGKKGWPIYHTKAKKKLLSGEKDTTVRKFNRKLKVGDLLSHWWGNWHKGKVVFLFQSRIVFLEPVSLANIRDPNFKLPGKDEPFWGRDGFPNLEAAEAFFVGCYGLEYMERNNLQAVVFEKLKPIRTLAKYGGASR